MFVEEKDFKKVIKVFYDVNQIMKNLYKNETSFSPIYNMSINKGFINFYYYDEESLPIFLNFKMSNDINKLFSFLKDTSVRVTIDGLDFFKFLKDCKSNITSIEINKDNIIFKGKKLIKENETFVETTYELTLDEDSFNKNSSYLTKEKELLKPELLAEFIPMNEKVIKKIYNTKQLVPVILDIDSSEICLEEDFINEGSYLKIYLNKKFINGLFYKVSTKQTKKDPEPIITTKYPEINVKIYITEREDIYLIIISVNNDLGILEHKFIVSDFNLPDIGNS